MNDRQGFGVPKGLLACLVIATAAIALFPVDRTCSRKGYACAQPPRQIDQTACYQVAKKPFVADVLNIGLSYSSFERCI